LVDHGQQLGPQGVQVDLVPQAGAEGGDGLGGVVAAPVEAAVHGGLDAAAGRLEQRRHGQGGSATTRLEPWGSSRPNPSTTAA
jgi:hypothetical protein